MNNKSDDRKPTGWFSRRHPTNAEHLAASGEYRAQHGRRARQASAARRLAEGRPVQLYTCGHKHGAGLECA